MRPDRTLPSLLLLLLGALVPASAYSAQVCTTQKVGKDEFRGISGSSDSNVIAVAKKGVIYQYDGANWNPMDSGSGEDLNDVEVVGATAFAVGQDGETLQLVDASWVSHTGFTDEDLLGVWAASATEAWVAGKNGTLYSFDGASWTDESAAAGTIPDDLTDIWGDADGVYVISEKGDLYRYDRASSSWLPRDTSCTAGDKFEDLWGDGSGNIYLVGKTDVFLYDGSSCVAIAAAAEDLFGISGWDQGGSVIAVGKKGTVLEYDGSTWTETQQGNKELQDDWVSPAGNAYYAGKNKELTVCQCVDCPVFGLVQFLITHDSYGIHCQDEVVQVQVIDSTTGTPRNDYSEQVTLDTQSGFGSWAALAGGGAFDDAILNDGQASYDWPLGETSAAFLLSYPEGPTLVDVDVYQTSDSGVRDNDAEGTIVFAPNGFTVTAAALTNPPPAVIVPFSAAQVAGTDFAVHIAAFGQTPNDPVCGIIESYAGPKDIRFWSDYINPGTGSRTVTIDGSPIATSEATAGTASIAFVNGQGAVTGKYKDAGQIRLQLKDDSMAHPDLPNGIRGATAGFVVKPDHFVLSNIEDGAGSPNPAAADASGAAFVAAGEPFAVTATAYDFEGDVTPNFGQELIAETVRLTATLVDPIGGDNPPLDSPTGFGPFAGGQATGSSFSWPEVGIISLVPAIGDGSYLGAGDVVGMATGNVGRFHAHHFTTAQNAPVFSTACAAGSFTYIGESFSYLTEPVITVTARAAAGEITENYDGGFFKLSNASLPDPVYSAVPATLDTSGLPSGASDPAVVSLGSGVGTLTFSSGTGLAFTRALPEAPFVADIRLSIDVADSDGAAALANPVQFGGAGGILFDAGPSMRYGRGRVLNAYGSELVNLALPMRTEYFVSPAVGFVPNIDDSCTTPVDVSLGAFTENLAAGETCVLDAGDPGESGAGCTAAALPALRYREPPLAGDFNLNLQAPGAGNDGSTTATADVPDWLEFDWNDATPGLEDPFGTAVFGIFRGEDRRIYTRELY